MAVEYDDVVQAQADYVDYPDANTPVRVNARSLAHKGHPIVKRTPSMWAPLTIDYPVESKAAEPKASTSGRKGSGG